MLVQRGLAAQVSRELLTMDKRISSRITFLVVFANSMAITILTLFTSIFLYPFMAYFLAGLKRN